MDVSTTNDAAIAFYSRLKLTCQIASYLGLAVSAGLGTFDLLFKEQHEKVKREPRTRLNRAGKTHLALFFTVSLLTVLSTIGKDLADAKLDSMSKEKAQAELRQALGGDIRNITTEALKPVVKGLSESISAQTKALDTSITQSESSLNGSVKQSGTALHEIVVESSSEAAMASLPIGQFEITAELPESLRPHPNPHKRLARWKQASGARCDQVPSDASLDYMHACIAMDRQIRQLGDLQDFVAAIDPRDSATLSFSFRMRSSLPTVVVRSDCNPFLDSRKDPVQQPHCVDFSDPLLGSQGKSFTVYDAGADGPELGLFESGVSATGDPGESKPLDNVFGRDLDLEAFLIIFLSPPTEKPRALPEHIRIAQRLSAVGAPPDKPIYRYYDLRLEKPSPIRRSTSGEIIRYVRQ